MFYLFCVMFTCIFMSREYFEPTEGNRVYITLHQKPENVPCLSSLRLCSAAL